MSGKKSGISQLGQRYQGLKKEELIYRLYIPDSQNLSAG